MSLHVTQLFEGVFLINNNIATLNFVQGEKVYGEELITIEGKEYRSWNPFRSKIAAGIKNGLKELPVQKNSRVLYLGSAEGTTISHLSDIVERSGIILGVEINAKTMQKFMYLCERRVNLVPVLADANQPESYKEYFGRDKVDFLFQDVSQKNQAEIFLKNARMYLKPGSKAMLSIKTRSISQTDSFKKIVENEKNKLEKEFEIIQTINLEPFEKEHALILCERK